MLYFWHIRTHSRHSLGRAFRRACWLSQNPRKLQCSSKVQRELEAGLLGRNPEEAIQFTRKWKQITHDHPPYPEIGKPWVRMESRRHRLGRPLERACRLSQNSRTLQCSLLLQRKQEAEYVGWNPRDATQVAPKRRDIVYDHLPYRGIRKSGFWVEVYLYPGERDTKDKPNLRQETNALIECNDVVVSLLKTGLRSESLETFEAAAQLMHKR
jgi:hypothetical protein